MATAYIIPAKRYQAPKMQVRNAVAVVVVRNMDGRKEYLLQQRGMNMHYSPGLLAIPGGAIEIRDRNPSDACERELWEECSIARNDIKSMTLITIVDKLNICANSRRSGNIFVYEVELTEIASQQPIHAQPRFKTEVGEKWCWMPVFADISERDDISGYSKKVLDLYR